MSAYLLLINYSTRGCKWKPTDIPPERFKHYLNITTEIKCKFRISSSFSTLIYLDKWIKLVNFEACIFLLLMIKQIWHDCLVVLYVLTQRYGYGLTFIMSRQPILIWNPWSIHIRHFAVTKHEHEERTTKHHCCIHKHGFRLRFSPYKTKHKAMSPLVECTKPSSGDF